MALLIFKKNVAALEAHKQIQDILLFIAKNSKYKTLEVLQRFV